MPLNRTACKVSGISASFLLTGSTAIRSDNQRFEKSHPERTGRLHPGEVAILRTDQYSHQGRPTWPGKQHLTQSRSVFAPTAEVQQLAVHVSGFVDESGQTQCTVLHFTKRLHPIRTERGPHFSVMAGNQVDGEFIPARQSLLEQVRGIQRACFLVSQTGTKRSPPRRELGPDALPI